MEIRNNKTGTGNTGLEYEHYMYPLKPYSEIVYYLAGKYDKLTAIWSLCYDSRNDDSLNDFDIYADIEKVGKLFSDCILQILNTFSEHE